MGAMHPGKPIFQGAKLCKKGSGEGNAPDTVDFHVSHRG